MNPKNSNVKNSSTRETQDSKRYQLDQLSYLNAYVYFSDTETREVVYCNDALRDLFQIGEYQGKKCYAAIYGETEPCSFCPLSELLDGRQDTVVWTLFDSERQRYFRSYNTLIKDYGSKTLHMQCSFDTTLSDNIRVEDQKRAYTLYHIAMNFITPRPLRDAIRSSLSILGHYTGVSHIRVFKETHENNLFECVYNWQESGRAQSMGIVLNSDVFYALINGECVVVENSFPNVERRRLSEKLRSNYFICAPIRTKEGLWGFLELDAGMSVRHWSAEDVSTIATVTDILASGISRTATEQQLYTTQRTLRVMLDNVPSGIFWKDKNAVYQGCNKVFARFLGLPEKSVLEKTDYELFSGDTLRFLLGPDKDTPEQNDKTVRHTGYVNDRNTGKKKCLSMTRIPVANEMGDTAYILGILDDITQESEAKKQMELRDKALKRAIKAEQQANRAKSNFISRINHEMRTPLNAILGMTHIARDTTDLKKMQHCLERIEASSSHLLSCINDVLDLAKIESDKLVLESEDFCLEKLLSNLCNVLSVSVNEKNQKLAIHIGPDVPGNFVGDAYRLGQVIINLLSNAVKFTPEGGEICLEVQATANDDDHTVLRFCVRDNGIGMKKEAIDKLFLPFEQADSSITRKYGGSGLGMSIAKQIVDRMGGAIEVWSKPGRGTAISFTVDLQNSAKDERPKLTRRLKGKPLRLILFDPDVKGVDTLRQAAGSKASIHHVADRQELLAAVAEGSEHTHQAVFLDIMQVFQNGDNLLELIQERFGEQKIVLILTTQQLDAYDEIVSSHNVEKLLHRPFLPSAFIQTVNELFESVPADGKKKPAIEMFSGRGVLVAEDIDVNAEIIREFLQKHGAQVLVAKDGKEAVELFTKKKRSLDLVLMDVHMPVMTGYEAAQHIRAVNPKVPIIAMTADVLTEDLQKCIDAGMNDYLTKPIDFERTTRVLLEHMPARRQSTSEKKQDISLIDDKEALAKMGCTGETYQKLLQSFLETPYRVGLQFAWQFKNMDRLRFLVHTLRGTAGNLSLKKLVEEAGIYEESLDARGFEKQALDKLLYWLGRTTVAIKKNCKQEIVL